MCLVRYHLIFVSLAGYGDLYPSTDAMKVFTMLYAACGVCMTGMLLGVVGQAYISYQMNKWEKRNGEIASEMIHELAQDHVSIEMDALCDDNEIVHEWLLNNSTLFAPLCRVFLIMMTGTVAMMTLEGWTPIESLYWTFQTALTIGYGDFRPVSDRTRWLCIVFIPLSVAVVTEVVATIAHRFIDRQLKQAQTQLFDSRITVDDLKKMDTDKDGDVTELEFIEYMLKTMGKVDEELWDKLRKMFRELDVDKDGTLMQRDLELLARRERCAGRTFKVLELSSYKRRVMGMAREKSLSPIGLSKSIG
jgi:voltage-gated potassium channel